MAGLLWKGTTRRPERSSRFFAGEQKRPALLPEQGRESFQFVRRLYDLHFLGEGTREDDVRKC